MIQEKYDLNGNLKRWSIGEEDIADIIPWAAKNPKLLAKEMAEMEKYFSYFYITIANEKKILQGDIFCPLCGDLITIIEGIEICCISCSTLFNPPQDVLLGWIGQLPSLIGRMENGEFGERGKTKGRPYLQKIHSELCRMDENRKNFIKSYFMMQEDKVYFAPIIYAFYPVNWPRRDPMIMVEKAYFDEVLFAGTNLNHSSFHAYTSFNRLLHLCLYSSWHQMTMRMSLTTRIVPKIIIDLMIADLAAVNKLDRVVSTLGTSVHNLYNWIGKEGRSEEFKKLYDRYVKID